MRTRIVRSSDGGQARRKKKPQSCEDSQDGAAIAAIPLPFMSKDNRDISSSTSACQLHVA